MADGVLSVMTAVSGARIADYRLHEEVPSRCTEVAYRASHLVLPRTARVAIVGAAFIGFRHAELQLLREACVLETLHHSGVPRVFECGVYERRAWTACEYITGASIEGAAASCPLAIGDALAIVRDAAAVLAHAHCRGVVHRDLTPRSIVRTPDRAFPVCVTDWGEASVHDRALPRARGSSAQLYRAPEQTGGDAGDATGDVYALGAVMFEAATLVLPAPPHKLPGVPAAFHQLLAAMLSRSAGARPTAEQVHAEASRLAELYSGSDALIEEVEVELVDISRGQPHATAGWQPQR